MNGIKNPLRKTRKDKGELRGSYRTRWQIEEKLEAEQNTNWISYRFRVTDCCPCCGRPSNPNTGTMFFLQKQMEQEAGKPKRKLVTLTPIQAEAKAKAIAKRRPMFDRTTDRSV